ASALRATCGNSYLQAVVTSRVATWPVGTTVADDLTASSYPYKQPPLLAASLALGKVTRCGLATPTKGLAMCGRPCKGPRHGWPPLQVAMPFTRRQLAHERYICCKNA
ncbi:hypothetical protein BHM03_00058406, partial [Ensete ventricosum]